MKIKNKAFLIIVLVLLVFLTLLTGTLLVIKYVNVNGELFGTEAAVGAFSLVATLIGTLFVAFTFSKNELLSVILALVFTAIYYLIIWLFGKKIDRQFTFYAEKEESIL
jgi:hypothetical protein